MKRDLLEKKDRILYEDNIAAAILSDSPAAQGHIVILPKKEAKSTEDLSEDELEHLFYLASYSATVLFESLGAHGTNIITNDGDEFVIEVIARKQEDGLSFQWKPKQISPEDMDAVKSSIADKILIGEDKKEEAKDEPKPEPEVMSNKPSKPPKIDAQPGDKSENEEEVNYMIQKLVERIP